MSGNPAVRVARAVTRRPRAARRVRLETPRTEMNATRVRTLNRMVDEQHARFGAGPAGPADLELLLTTARSGSVPVELLDDEVAPVRARVAATAAVLSEHAVLVEEARAIVAGLPDLLDGLPRTERTDQ